MAAGTTGARMSSNSDSSIDVTDPFARRLLAKYLERREADLEKLRSALSQNDYSRIERTGHNLFGSGAAYGLAPISELGADLEQAAKDRDSARIATVVDSLEAFVRRVSISA